MLTKHYSLSPKTNTLPGHVAPINRLPPELLIEILFHYIAPNGRLEELIRLAEVCKLWLNIIQDTSPLWSRISSSEKAPIIRRAFKTVGPAPLDLTYVQDSAKINQEEFFALAKTKIEQWRSLVVIARADSLNRLQEDLAALTMPKLESIRLGKQGWEEHEDSEQDHLPFGGNPAPPCLSHVNFNGVSINLHKLQLRNLRSLELRYISGLASNEIVYAVTESPRLESLCLVELTGLIGTDHAETTPTTRPVLGSLLRLTLEDIPVPLTNQILLSIDIPSVERLEVQDFFLQNSVASLLSVGLRQHSQTLSRLASHAQTYEIIISSSPYQRITIGGIKLEYPRSSVDQIVETFDWLANNVRQDLETLPLRLELWERDHQWTYLDWFTRRTTVTELQLIGRPIDETISLLGKQTTPGPTNWLVPHVEVFGINFVWGTQDTTILKAIEERQTAGQGEKLEPGVVLPRRLREIWLSYGHIGLPRDDKRCNKLLKEVRRLAPKAEIYWEGKQWSR